MSTTKTDQRLSIYRKTAIEQHIAGQASKGQALRLSPSWMSWTYKLITGISIATLLFLCLGRMNEYAEGYAFIYAANKIDVTSPVSATVLQVAVETDMHVAEGQVLVRLEDQEEQAAVSRIQGEIDANILACLQDPRDQAARRSLSSLRPQLEFARERLAARRLVAPRSGIVCDVRTRPGQTLQPGQTAITLSGSDSVLSLAIVLPGYYRPQLKNGLQARFEINGYPYAYQPVTLAYIADEATGPGEVRRYLGPSASDAIPLEGSNIFAIAELENDFFVVDGQQYPMTDGLQGRVQIRLRSVPIILSLLPSLRMLLGENNDGFDN